MLGVLGDPRINTQFSTLTTTGRGASIDIICHVINIANAIVTSVSDFESVALSGLSTHLGNAVQIRVVQNGL